MAEPIFTIVNSVLDDKSIAALSFSKRVQRAEEIGRHCIAHRATTPRDQVELYRALTSAVFGELSRQAAMSAGDGLIDAMMLHDGSETAAVLASLNTYLFDPTPRLPNKWRHLAYARPSNEFGINTFDTYDPHRLRPMMASLFQLQRNRITQLCGAPRSVHAGDIFELYATLSTKRADAAERYLQADTRAKPGTREYSYKQKMAYQLAVGPTVFRSGTASKHGARVRSKTPLPTLA